MILRIFIAIMALNTLHASTRVLHTENDPLLARNATTEQHTSWSVWSVMSSAYHMIADHNPTPEEILREQVRNIVFPDGRNAAGELVRDYKLPLVTEVNVDHDNMLDVIMRLDGKMSRSDDQSVYCISIRSIADCASKGNRYALSMMAWLFESGDQKACTIRWPYINKDRAALFGETANESLKGNKTQEQIYEVLQELLKTGRESLHIQPENKKGR